MPTHYPVPRETITFDTDDTDGEVVILPGTMRIEVLDRCGCTDALEHLYGEEGHL